MKRLPKIEPFTVTLSPEAQLVFAYLLRESSVEALRELLTTTRIGLGGRVDPVLMYALGVEHILSKNPSGPGMGVGPGFTSYIWRLAGGEASEGPLTPSDCLRMLQRLRQGFVVDEVLSAPRARRNARGMRERWIKSGARDNGVEISVFRYRVNELKKSDEDAAKPGRVDAAPRERLFFGRKFSYWFERYANRHMKGPGEALYLKRLSEGEHPVIAARPWGLKPEHQDPRRWLADINANPVHELWIHVNYWQFVDRAGNKARKRHMRPQEIVYSQRVLQGDSWYQAARDIGMTIEQWDAVLRMEDPGDEFRSPPETSVDWKIEDPAPSEGDITVCEKQPE